MRICTVPDIWATPDKIHFLAIACVIVYEEFRTEPVILGVERMFGAHSAENIKSGTERIVNKYNFNKSKIISVVCDEGRNLLRLFRQLEWYDSDDDDLAEKSFEETDKEDEIEQ